MKRDIPIQQFTYTLPEERIAKYPLSNRDDSKLLIYSNKTISEDHFIALSNHIEEGDLMVFNNTKVIRARIIFFKESGAKIEIFCLEPHSPAHYESAFSVKGSCRWKTLVGGRKKWKNGALKIKFIFEGDEITLESEIIENNGRESIVEFRWDSDKLTFGEILHELGKIPIPPYLCRESEESDLTTYQTLYSKVEGSVAAPTAGLHFTDRVFENLAKKSVERCEVTLHVGAGTFLPVKSANAAEHPMHIEHFEVEVKDIERLCSRAGRVIAVGTTSVRTLESLSVLGYRTFRGEAIDETREVGQWEAYDIPSDISGHKLLTSLVDRLKSEGKTKLIASTAIMISPGYNFKVVGRIITNFHQPQSTLLLLISAAVGERWHDIYDYALSHDFRFLSYGDSSLISIDPL